ncbi:MAG TPA: transglycosylase domain-containing protein, partial [Candidatus Limnocylindrales bacterium]
MRPTRPAARPIRPARDGRLWLAAHRAALGHRGRPSVLPTVGAVSLVAILAVALGSTAMGAASVATVAALQQGLPDPSQLEHLSYAQPTVVYDQSGKVVLATFGRENRVVLAYDQIPHLLVDATTAAEDHSFWQNSGFDPAAILSAAAQNLTSSAGDRGASTITQQLVRARLLPPSLTAPGSDQYLRKAKEILQSARVASAYPGEPGKELVITAYLNQIFYGHDAYGIGAAARTYFGITDLSQLTLAQAALLAGLPKSPTTLDPYLYAKPDAKGRLVVPPDSPPVVRRDWVLSQLASPTSGTRWTRPTAAQLAAAQAEPVVLSGVPQAQMKAPQFDWAVRQQLDQLLGGSDAVETGGYRVITSLDWNAQQLAEKWVYAGAVLPNLPVAQMETQIKALKIPSSEAWWIRSLRGRDPHDAALVAVDYRTGNVLAYVGSAGYYLSNLASPKFNPQYDVAGIGARQPGSAFKPIVYATGFDRHVIDPATLLLDTSTEFGPGWTPHDADMQERGPLLARRALQYSLNIPTIRAYGRVGPDAVTETAHALGLDFPGGPDALAQAGLAGAIGTVEVRLIDLVSAYGALANMGQAVPHRMILEIDGPDGKVVWKAPQPTPTQAISPQAAFLIDDVLKGNTDPSQNLIWGPMFHLNNGPQGARRPAAIKTGTTDWTKDLSAYGFLAPSSTPGLPSVAAGVWMGNSDHSDLGGVAFAADGPGRVWHAFLNEYTKGWPLADWRPPQGVVRATVDAFSGGAPGPWTRRTTEDWFIAGTQPGAPGQIDPPGLLYRDCGSWVVDPTKAEAGAPPEWIKGDRDWAQRAARGVGVANSVGTTTAYLWGQAGWGGPVAANCEVPRPATRPHPTPPA